MADTERVIEYDLYSGSESYAVSETWTVVESFIKAHGQVKYVRIFVTPLSRSDWDEGITVLANEPLTDEELVAYLEGLIPVKEGETDEVIEKAHRHVVDAVQLALGILSGKSSEGDKDG